jgi:hypothetical protein
MWRAGAILATLAIGACSYAPARGASDDDPPAGVDGAVTTDPDAPATATCSNGALDPDEVGIDCGGACAARCTTIFEADANTLALFELNGDLTDSSGNGRDATSIGGTFVPSAFGMGFSPGGTSTQGFQWTAFANMIAHPYTVEMVITPEATGCFKKLFGASDSADAGWYYCGRFRAYPNNSIGPDLGADERHYIAIVSTSASQVTVFVNGTSIGSTNAAITTPANAAIFFRDDTSTQRTENLSGVVDAVRISNKSRSLSEISAVQAKLATQP